MTQTVSNTLHAYLLAIEVILRIFRRIEQSKKANRDDMNEDDNDKEDYEFV